MWGNRRPTIVGTTVDPKSKRPLRLSFPSSALSSSSESRLSSQLTQPTPSDCKKTSSTYHSMGHTPAASQPISSMEHAPAAALQTQHGNHAPRPSLAFASSTEDPSYVHAHALSQATGCNPQGQGGYYFSDTTNLLAPTPTHNLSIHPYSNLAAVQLFQPQSFIQIPAQGNCVLVLVFTCLPMILLISLISKSNNLTNKPLNKVICFLFCLHLPRHLY